VLLHGDGNFEVLTVGLELGLELAHGGVLVVCPVGAESGREERVSRVGVRELVGVLEETERLKILGSVEHWQPPNDGIVLVLILILREILVRLILHSGLRARGGGDWPLWEVLVLVGHAAERVAEELRRKLS
jgi:hypothetical protein